MSDSMLYCLDLNLYICFRVGSRSSVTFKTKLSVTAVGTSFQLQSVYFCQKELHLKCCKGLELNIVTQATKILKGFRDIPPCQSVTLAQYEQLTLPRCPEASSMVDFPSEFLCPSIQTCPPKIILRKNCPTKSNADFV